jgi:hypothetical protein
MKSCSYSGDGKMKKGMSRDGEHKEMMKHHKNMHSYHSKEAMHHEKAMAKITPKIKSGKVDAKEN